MNAKAKPETGPETGFSLIELMVAMLITLIVSGAIFGLLSSGHSAFRREPELSDRQQSIRLAMDVISRDVVNAVPAIIKEGVSDAEAEAARAKLAEAGATVEVSAT